MLIDRDPTAEPTGRRRSVAPTTSDSQRNMLVLSEGLKECTTALVRYGEVAESSRPPPASLTTAANSSARSSLPVTRCLSQAVRITLIVTTHLTHLMFLARSPSFRYLSNSTFPAPGANPRLSFHTMTFSSIGRGLPHLFRSSFARCTASNLTLSGSR